MKPYEFKRVYHPKFGRFVYKHKGSGVIVDNIFKPLRKVASNVLKMAKPTAKKQYNQEYRKQEKNLAKKHQKEQEI